MQNNIGENTVECSLGDNQDLSEFALKLNMGFSRHYLDDSLTMIWANNAFYEKTGYSEKEFLFRFPSLKRFGFLKSCDFGAMISYLQKEYEDGKSCAEYEICMPVNHKDPVWMKLSCTFSSPKSNGIPMVYILYTDINELMKKEKESYIREKEYKKNLEWMISEYKSPIYISDMETYELLYTNESFSNAMQISAKQAAGQKCFQVIHGRDEPCPFCTNSLLSKDKVYNWEFYNSQLRQAFQKREKILQWNGRKAHLSLSIPLDSINKKAADITVGLKNIQVGLIRLETDDHRSILWYNDKFLEMLGYTKKQFEMESLNRCTYMHPDDFERASMIASDLKNTGDNAVLEVRVYTRSKEERIWAITLYKVNSEDSRDGVPSIYSMGIDLTEERKRNEIKADVIETDSLTGVLNRAETERQINEYIQNNGDSQAALFMVDTDDFKMINDNYGHIVGDMVLTAMADGMKAIMRKHDIVGRIGGDEFMVFMKDISCADDAVKKAKELTEMFDHLFEDEKNSVSVSSSIGIAVFPGNGETFKNLYSNADRALYQVKKLGKNSYMLYDDISAESVLDNKYFTPRTRIESENNASNVSRDLLGYIFEMLYDSEDLDKSVNDVLEIIGKKFDVSRAYIFENSEDNLYTSNTYEWCSEGITSEIANLQNLSFSEHGNYKDLFKDNTVFYCRDIRTLNPGQADILAAQGIRSTLQCAIMENKTFTGMIGFDECTGLRLWTQEEISLLIVLSRLISLFLQKKKMGRMEDKIVHYQNILGT
ncbi:diguanylate cyclase domain-containing protein [Extibacter muris]|uniref:sensor domain-containing diguanylate cyclase n=1 Tax=Extibacter muris TaxID=1796622 RepID=UPI0021C65972|nr:diguanylate cyclase [Extibacter muris]MCU0077908.1 diguanylate cyclase [Extibacter muris]